MDTRGPGQEWERDFLVFVYSFVPLEFSLCAWNMYIYIIYILYINI